ncbi:MAG: ABC-2 family transporter protein [Gemmataceae bacterium]|nr:ABC-2 family transporter protein [Gemmataceae bacterium]
MLARYFRLWFALARFSFARELAFRGNFLIKIFVEVLWLGILLLFYDTLFAKTDTVADWTRAQYLFFVGVHFALGGLIETFFLENCNQFADLVRTGDLDFYLLKPMDEQFLVTCRTVDWSCAPNVLMGFGVMIFALVQLGRPVGAGDVLLFLTLLTCGCLMAYGFLTALTSVSVWFTRNQSLMEVWWLFSTLMRYPREIFRGDFASPVGWFFSFAVPIILVTNVPARSMVRILEPWLAIYMVAATLGVLVASRLIFRYALSKYRSASS